jgi:hypothetical protein
MFFCKIIENVLHPRSYYRVNIILNFVQSFDLTYLPFSISNVCALILNFVKFFTMDFDKLEMTNFFYFYFIEYLQLIGQLCSLFDLVVYYMRYP